MPVSRQDTSEHHMLIIHDGAGRRVVQLEDVAYSVGRDASNAIVVDGPSISRQHALLVRLPVPNQGYRYRVLDGNSEGKASANGVYINGERKSMHELNKGDIVRFGKEIKATYMTVAMEQVEFLNYLESISYSSIKSDVTDARATMVSPEFIGQSDATTVVAPLSHSNSQGPTSKATIQFSRKELSKQLKAPVRLWMVVVGAIASLSAVSLWLVLSARNTPNPAGATTPTQSLSIPSQAP
ncbi:MAG: FHA domain-containing protein [Thermosynechococcaceae cyanobacterium]